MSSVLGSEIFNDFYCRIRFRSLLYCKSNSKFELKCLSESDDCTMCVLYSADELWLVGLGVSWEGCVLNAPRDSKLC